MQQRQLRLGDIRDDYCPRERRVTNHAVVAMVGDDVKQTRGTTCDAEHEYKHAKVPRQRRNKGDGAATLYAQVLAGGPKHAESRGTDARIAAAPEANAAQNGDPAADPEDADAAGSNVAGASIETQGDDRRGEEAGDADAERPRDDDERENEPDGPVHRPLIRATLPRPEGQPPPQRPAPEFTIRQPGGGRPNRFRPRHARGGMNFQGGGRPGGHVPGGPHRDRGPRHGGGRPPVGPRSGNRQGAGRKRSK
jgi:hypothetical protein